MGKFHQPETVIVTGAQDVQRFGRTISHQWRHLSDGVSLRHPVHLAQLMDMAPQHRPGQRHIAQHASGLDAFELGLVTNQQDPGTGAHRLKQTGHELQRHHGRLVHDDQVVGQRAVGMMGKAGVHPRGPSKQAVNGDRLNGCHGIKHLGGDTHRLVSTSRQPGRIQCGSTNNLCGMIVNEVTQHLTGAGGRLAGGGAHRHGDIIASGVGGSEIGQQTAGEGVGLAGARPTGEHVERLGQHGSPNQILGVVVSIGGQHGIHEGQRLAIWWWRGRGGQRRYPLRHRQLVDELALGVQQGAPKHQGSTIGQGIGRRARMVGVHDAHHLVGAAQCSTQVATGRQRRQFPV